MLSKIRLSKARAMIVIGMAIYIGIFWWIYANYLPLELGAIDKVIYIPCSTGEDVLYFSLAMVPSFFLPTRVDKPSQFTWWILVLTVVMPTCIVGPHILSSRYSVMPMILSVLICSIVMMSVSSLKPLKLPRVSIHPALFWTLILGSSLAIFIILIATYGLPSSSLTLSTAEQLRAAFKSKNKDVSVFIRYLARWEGNVIAPLFIGYGLLKKNWLFVLLGCASETMLFLITTLREYFLTPLFLLALAVWIFSFKKYSGPGLMGCWNLASGIQAFWLTLNKSALLPLLFFARFVVTGGQLSAYYYEYFTKHDPALFGATFGKLFWAVPYGRDVGMIIGGEYLIMGTSSTTTNANAHIWADAYGNLGFPGLIGTTILTMIVFWIIDSAYANIDRRIAIMMTVMIALSVNAEGLQSTMLSGGVIPMIVLGLIGGRALKEVPPKQKRKRSAQPSIGPNVQLSPE